MTTINLFLSFLFLMNTSDALIFNFTKEANLSSWQVIDDGVMGGRSQGNFAINEEGNAVFEGTVSLDNYGGFSSVRHRLLEKDISKYTKVLLRIKGDGKKYQFRIKEKRRDYYSYITTFQTTNKWQTITLEMHQMYPAFRGRTLNMDNLKPNKIEEIAILIGNKKAEKFRLEIDSISLQ
ncbi:MAG: CIA30 family protein [Polaribacter sp.]|nr:CIA30 family protein [Polaribacter sp.]MDG1321805.1 CIA30 family protein [Polaribacter sp.]